MGRPTIARQKACAAIGQARVTRLEDNGLIVLEATEYARLTARLAELERRTRLLRELALGSTAPADVAAQILATAMAS